LIAATTVCAVLLALPPATSVPQAPAGRQAAVSEEFDWVSQDTSLEQLSSMIAQIETKAWTIRAAPEVDPWAPEVDALARAVAELEQNHARPAF
jgi:hypothetical protein